MSHDQVQPVSQPFLAKFGSLSGRLCRYVTYRGSKILVEEQTFLKGFEDCPLCGQLAVDPNLHGGAWNQCDGWDDY